MDDKPGESKSSSSILIITIAVILVLIMGLVILTLKLQGSQQAIDNGASTQTRFAVVNQDQGVPSTEVATIPNSLMESSDKPGEATLSAYDAHHPDGVDSALALMHKGAYGQALAAWDEILAEDPQNHFALGQRAMTRLAIARDENLLDRYIELNMEALRDTDEAIRLHPSGDGDYYLARSNVFENLSRVPGNRVDQDRLIEISLDNLYLGLELPHTNPTAYYGPPNLLLRLGRCEEVVERIESIFERRGDDAAVVPVLHYLLANAHFCNDDVDLALAQIDTALSVLHSCSYHFRKVIMLYDSGKVENALGQLNQNLAACPNFYGYRYYFRALLLYELGINDMAIGDLQVGSSNTWGQSGLKAYVEGLLALDRGDREQAIQSMRLAERTIDRSFGPHFIERIQADLSALGAEPEHVEPNNTPPATPLPTLPTGHPTPAPEIFVRYTTGTGLVEIKPGEVLYFHFTAPRGFSYEQVDNLRAHFIGAVEGLGTNLELQIHHPASSYWDRIEPVWGGNPIDSAAEYVNTSGDINIRLRNVGTEIVELKDFGISISVVNEDGMLVSYSYLDE
jgi:tetratricopeptide (TPR) repeat protein